LVAEEGSFPDMADLAEGLEPVDLPQQAVEERAPRSGVPADEQDPNRRVGHGSTILGEPRRGDHREVSCSPAMTGGGGTRVERGRGEAKRRRAVARAIVVSIAFVGGTWFVGGAPGLAAGLA